MFYHMCWGADNQEAIRAPLLHVPRPKSTGKILKPSNVWPQDLSIFRCFNVNFKSSMMNDEQKLLWISQAAVVPFFAARPRYRRRFARPRHKPIQMCTKTARQLEPQWSTIDPPSSSAVDPLLGANGKPKVWTQTPIGKCTISCKDDMDEGWGFWWVLDGLEAHFFTPWSWLAMSRKVSHVAWTHGLTVVKRCVLCIPLLIVSTCRALESRGHVRISLQAMKGEGMVRLKGKSAAFV